MVTANINGTMADIMKDTMKMIKKMDKESIYGQTVASTLVNGKTENSTALENTYYRTARKKKEFGKKGREFNG